MQRLHFNMLFQFLLTNVFKSELFSFLQKVDHVIVKSLLCMVNTLRPLPLGHLVKTVYKNTESDHSKNDENNNVSRQNLCSERKNGMACHESRKFRKKKLLYIFGNFA